MNLETNMGNNDRMIRVIVGFVLIVVALRQDTALYGLIGAVLLATAYLRVCPGYRLFGMRTDKNDSTPAK